jgi:hypothetical protein
MRSLACTVLCLLLGIPLTLAAEASQPCNGMTMAQCITLYKQDTPLPLENFKLTHRFENSAIHIRDFRGRRWFKTLTFAYWLSGAVRSFQSDNDIKLPSALPHENGVTTTFGTTEENRTKFVSRSIILFPLDRHKSVDQLWALQVARKGVAVTFVLNLEHLRSRKK